jgi:hypothetical protein
MLRDFPFMDARPNREFLPLADFAKRSGIPIDLFMELADNSKFDYVVVSGERFVSWDRAGSGISPTNSMDHLDEMWRLRLKEKRWNRN